MPEKDAYIVLDIIKRTIAFLKYEPIMSDEDFLKLTPEQKYEEIMTPRFCLYKFTDEVDLVFIRFVGDETPLASVVYFPIEAVWAFLNAARNYFKSLAVSLSEEELEKLISLKAMDMLILMLRNIYPRIMATMRSITEETINEWYRQEHERYREHSARNGFLVPDLEPKIKQVRRGILKEYRKEVGSVWQNEERLSEDYTKLRFAEEYEKLFKHWETISLLFRNKRDWQGYAKMPGFEDTPNDILDEMKGSHHRGMSQKALEHAARRVGLVNLKCTDPAILDKRRAGIQCSGFSEQTLYRYLEEGKVIRDWVASRNDKETSLKEP